MASFWGYYRLNLACVNRIVSSGQVAGPRGLSFTRFSYHNIIVGRMRSFNAG